MTPPAPATPSEHKHEYAVDASCDCGLMLSDLVKTLSRQLAAAEKERDAMSAMLDRIAATVADYFHAPNEENVADGVDGMLDALSLDAREAREQRDRAEAALADALADGREYLQAVEVAGVQLAALRAAVEAAPHDFGQEHGWQRGRCHLLMHGHLTGTAHDDDGCPGCTCWKARALLPAKEKT